MFEEQGRQRLQPSPQAVRNGTFENNLRANGYPTTLINKTLQKQKPNQTTTNRYTNRNTDQERPKVLYLPYVKHTSELIQRACRRLGVRVAFKSHGTQRRTLMRVKNARPELKMKEVVYEVPCKDCKFSYIGETRRNLKKRLMEHKAAVRRGDRNNGIVVHAWDHDHRVDWEAARVLELEPQYWKRHGH